MLSKMQLLCHGHPRLWLAFWCALAADSCSYPDVTSAAAAACARYAANTCQTLQRCGEVLLLPYGSLEDCGSQVGASCLYEQMQPDVLSTSAAVSACADAMVSVDCTALLNRELPAACGLAEGRRATAAACSVGAQCASGRCVGVGPGVWGHCRELAQNAEACASFADCRAGLVCASDGLCASLVAFGEPCSEQAPCRAPFACYEGVCQELASAAPVCDAIGCPSEVASALLACQSFSQTLCTRLMQCAPSLVERTYGDLATCTARNVQVCVARQQTPDVVSSGPGLDACTQALANVECGALFDNNLPMACQFAPGARLDGQACGDDAQCASTRCARAADAACGTCTALGHAQAPCRASSDCVLGFVCSAGFVCAAGRRLDESCNEREPCAFPSTCAVGRCSAALGSGAACDFSNDRCDRYNGLACSGSPALCRPWLQAPAGQPCGSTAVGWVECYAGARCGIAAGATAGTCEGPVTDGATCVPVSGPACLSPARCIGGVCRLAAAGECS
ncbi:MAG: hypothetical protein RL701_4694 [Pseudomonadota bacterium]|jgi:hypothetical protein